MPVLQNCICIGSGIILGVAAPQVAKRVSPKAKVTQVAKKAPARAVARAKVGTASIAAPLPCVPTMALPRDGFATLPPVYPVGYAFTVGPSVGPVTPPSGPVTPPPGGGPEPVPEPAAIGLLGLGVAALAWRRRRQA